MLGRADHGRARSDSYSSPLKIELEEDVVLPHEWSKESNWYWREFRVLAAVLNRILGLGSRHRGGSEDCR